MRNNQDSYIRISLQYDYKLKEFIKNMNISEIQRIRNKINTQGWSKFIVNMSINGLHGLNEQHIEFKFPICAIVGENGTCKSTILKLLACAYRGNDKKDGFFPSNFFPDTMWENFKDVKAEYQIRQGERIGTYKITKPNERWRGLPERPINNVFFFDLNRIQPIDSIIGSSKVASKKIEEIKSRELKEESTFKISEIMERKYLSGRYATTNVPNSIEVGLLKLPFGEISRFHQGSGEAMIFDFIATIENIPDGSLVIIDEIESSLHPKAQRRLIHNLLQMARVKTLQIILSTHSPYILSELPEESRILLKRLKDEIKIVYAPSVEFCLSQIDEEIHAELDILVEDEESQMLLDSLIRYKKPEIAQRTRILPVGSADIIQLISRIAESGKLPYNVLGVVDADITENEYSSKLPGKFNPEKQVLLDIIEKDKGKIVSEMLNQTESEIKTAFETTITIQDSRTWIEELAKKFNISSKTLWAYLSVIWVRYCLLDSDSKNLLEAIEKRLQTHN